MESTGICVLVKESCGIRWNPGPTEASCLAVYNTYYYKQEIVGFSDSQGVRAFFCGRIPRAESGVNPDSRIPRFLEF